jgi:hypothetical protein
MFYRVRDLVLHVTNIYYELKINVISNIKIGNKVKSYKILNVGRMFLES